MALSRHTELGRAGEHIAARFLKKIGYRILRRNCRSRHGEIDLIARDGDAVVFVEVKTRSSRTWGDPETAVTPTKQRRMAHAAITFAEKHRLREHPLRLDVVAVLTEAGHEPEIKHFKNAFPLRTSRR